MVDDAQTLALLRRDAPAVDAGAYLSACRGIFGAQSRSDDRFGLDQPYSSFASLAVSPGDTRGTEGRARVCLWRKPDSGSRVFSVRLARIQRLRALRS